MLKEVLINWIEKKLIKYKNKEKFALFWMSQLFDSNFGKKTKISTIRLLLVITLSSIILVVYNIQKFGAKLATDMQPSKLISVIYIQLPGTIYTIYI